MFIRLKKRKEKKKLIKIVYLILGAGVRLVMEILCKRIGL